MSLDDKICKELEALFAQLDEDSLTKHDKQRLAELLGQSPDAIDLYLEHFEMDAMLRETYGSLILPDAAVSAPPTRYSQPGFLLGACVGTLPHYLIDRSLVLELP